MKLTALWLSTALSALALGVSGGQAANLINNGSFENGDFTGWTQGGNTGSTVVASSGFDGITAEDGNYFAALGPIGSDGTLSQTFTDTPGATYESIFYLASDGDTPNDFGVTGPGGLFIATMDDIPASPFVEYYGYFTGSGSDTITFNFRNDPGYLWLDNVSVISVVPEPATWGLMLAGMGIAGASLRRRRIAATA
jgi:hypothetical protein